MTDLIKKDVVVAKSQLISRGDLLVDGNTVLNTVSCKEISFDKLTSNNSIVIDDCEISQLHSVNSDLDNVMITGGSIDCQNIKAQKLEIVHELTTPTSFNIKKVNVTESITALHNQIIVGFIFDSEQENYETNTPGGVLSSRTYYTSIKTDNTQKVFTLNEGNVSGQLKVIRMNYDGGGDAVINSTCLAGYSKITLNNSGEEITLMWNGSKWRVIKNLGAIVQ